MRVSKITVARLFNLGNYEHKRVEIAVETEPSWSDARPSKVVQELEEIVEKLGPGVHAQKALVEAERNNVKIHEAGLVRDKLTAERDAALKRLDALGGYVTES